MDMIRGQKLKIADVTSGASQFVVNLQLVSPLTIDVSCFGVDSAGKLSDERYMTFFNQTQTPCGGVKFVNNSNNQSSFQIDLTKIPASIDKLVFTAAIDGTGTMAQLQASFLTITQGSSCRFAFSGQDFAAERALMVAEIYRKEGVWRIAAVGQGFNGGLDALVKHFGGEVAEATPAATVAPTPTKANLTKRVQLEKRIEQEAPQLMSLVKKVHISLEKKQLSEVKARVAIVLDASGSMSRQYKTGRVQEIIDRVLSLAVCFDDDGDLECWAFATQAKQLEPVNLQNVKNYIKNRGIHSYGADINIGGSNNEPIVIQEIINYFNYTQTPAYIIFITDGGVSQSKKIKELITRAAHFPIFWQFVGIAGSNYGILEKLDDMTGRVVDNCNFFALDDLHQISEQELYDRLLEEFPQWLTAAKAKQIIR